MERFKYIEDPSQKLFVDSLLKQLADAQATIAALEETILKMGENAAVVAKDAMAAKEQVAALQAERDTARRRVDELEAREVDVVLLREDLEKRTVELEAANHTASTHQALWREACDQRDKAQAELERVRGLVKALPKVEGEIAVKRTEVDLSDVWGITLNGYFTFQSALFDGKEEAESYAAILKHRQGMEA